MTTFSVEEFRKMAETKPTIFPILGGLLIILAGVMFILVSAQHFIVSVSPQTATGEPLTSDDQVWAVCIGTLFFLFFLMNMLAGLLAMKRKDAMKPMLSALIVGTISLLLSASFAGGGPIELGLVVVAIVLPLLGIWMGGMEGKDFYRILGLLLPILGGLVAIAFVFLIPPDPSISLFLIPLAHTFGAIGLGFIVYSKGEFP